jgi:hypothetical protein
MSSGDKNPAIKIAPPTSRRLLDMFPGAVDVLSGICFTPPEANRIIPNHGYSKQAAQLT